MSLVKHAEYELRKAGLFDTDSDYNGMIGEAVLALIKVHAAQGHSGMSHTITLDIFNRVANFKALSPISNDPEEWVLVSEFPDLWQNRRESTNFSLDGGKTWYDIDDPEKKNWPINKDKE